MITKQTTYEFGAPALITSKLTEVSEGAALVRREYICTVLSHRQRTVFLIFVNSECHCPRFFRKQLTKYEISKNADHAFAMWQPKRKYESPINIIAHFVNILSVVLNNVQIRIQNHPQMLLWRQRTTATDIVAFSFFSCWTVRCSTVYGYLKLNQCESMLDETMVSQRTFIYFCIII